MVTVDNRKLHRKLRKAMIGNEERWVLACSKFLEDPDWMTYSQDRAVGMIMKLSGGALDPHFVRQRIRLIYEGADL